MKTKTTSAELSADKTVLSLCAERLAAAILETAVHDRTFLESMDLPVYRVGGITLRSDELDQFANSKWCRFLMDMVDSYAVNIQEAKRLGRERAQRIKGRAQNPEGQNLRTYPFNGEEHTAVEWANIIGIPAEVIRERWSRRGVKGASDWLICDRYRETYGRKHVQNYKR